MTTLRIAVDSRGAREGAKDAAQALDGVSTSAERTTRTIDKVDAAIRRGVVDASRAGASGLGTLARAALDAAQWLERVALFGAGAATAFIAFDVRTATTIDRLNDMANALGLTVQELTLIQFASERAGTSVEDVALGIKKIASQAQAFAAGSETARAFFESLNVAPTGKGTLELLEAAASAIDAMPDRVQKVALAQDLLGRNGVRLLELFRDQGAGLRAVSVDAQRFGAIVDEDLANKAARAADAWSDFKFGLASVGNEILRGTGPELVRFLDDIGATLARNRYTAGAFFGALVTSAHEIAAIYAESGLARNAASIGAGVEKVLVSTMVNLVPPLSRSAFELGKVVGAAIVDGIFLSSKERLIEGLVANDLGSQLVRKLLPSSLVPQVDHLAQLLDDANRFDKLTADAAARGNPFGGANLARLEYERAVKGDLSAVGAQVADSTRNIIDSFSAAAERIRFDMTAAYSTFLVGADDGTKKHVENMVRAFQSIPIEAKLNELASIASDQTASLYRGMLTGVVFNPFTPEQFMRAVDEAIAKTREAQRVAATAPPAAPRGFGFDSDPTAWENKLRGLDKELQKRHDASIQAVNELMAAKANEIAVVGLSNDERTRALALYDFERKAIGLDAEEVARYRTQYATMIDEVIAAGQRKELADSISGAVGRGLDDALVKFDNFRDSVRAVFEDIQRIAAHTFVSQPITDALSKAAQSSFSAIGLFSPTTTASAMGNVFHGNEVVRYALGGFPGGPIINHPTEWSMGNGRRGVAGENGPEWAIAPLQRTPTGALGVNVGGMRGPASVIVNVTIQGNASEDTMRRSARQIGNDVQRIMENYR